MREVLDAGGYDVVHAHASIGSPAAWTGAYLGTRSGIPVVLTYHSILSRYRLLLRGADPFLGWRRWRAIHSGVSEVVARDLRRLLPGHPVEILPNGVDPDEWIVRPRVPGADGFRMVSVLRLTRKKRPAVLLRILRDVLAYPGVGGNVHLTVVGDGPLGPSLKRLAHRLGVSGHVTFTGALDRPGVARALDQAHLFVMPSIMESFGIAALEARMSGLPVVGRSEGGMDSFVRHGVDGFLVDDDAEMSAAVARLVTGGRAMEELVAGASDVPSHLRWSRVAEAHEDLYRRAMERFGRGVSSLRGSGEPLA